MTAISKCHANYIHYVMFIMYMIPISSDVDSKSSNAHSASR
jgi:hypothetical protein